MIVQDVIDAIRKDGLKQVKGYYYRIRIQNGGGAGMSNYLNIDETAVGACAVGQAAINLGLRATELDKALGRIPISASAHYSSLGPLIRNLNDVEGLTFEQIADALETILNDTERQARVSLY